MGNTAASKLQKTFSSRFKEIMGSTDLTIHEVATAVGVSTDQIYNYQTLNSLPKLEKLLAICNLFHVSADYLMGITDTQQLKPDLRSAQEYTGLSERAVERLHEDIGTEANEFYSALIQKYGFIVSELLSHARREQDYANALNSLNERKELTQEDYFALKWTAMEKGYNIVPVDLYPKYRLYDAVNAFQRVAEDFINRTE